MTTSSTTFIQEIRSLPRPVWILSSGTFIDRFGMFVIPFLVLFLTGRGMAKELAGVAAGLVGVGGLCAGFLGGYLTDWIGRRHTIALSMFGGAATGLLLYACATQVTDSGYGLTFLLALLYGLFRGLYHAASSSLLADLVPPSHRVAGFALLRFAINLGWALGMTAAGFLAKHSFLWLFLVDAGTSVIFGTFALFLLPHGVRSSRAESSWKPALKSIRGNGAFLAVCFNALVIGIIYSQWSSSFAVYLRDHGALAEPEKMYGWIMALNGFLIVALEMPISALIRAWSPPRMIALGTILAAIGFGLFFWIPGITGMIVAMSVFTLGEMVCLPMQGAYVSILAPDKMRGRYNGMAGLMWSAATIFSPVLGLWVLGIGPLLLWVGLIALSLAGAAALIRFGETKPAVVPETESALTDGG